jgi:hypothetical protein
MFPVARQWRTPSLVANLVLNAASTTNEEDANGQVVTVQAQKKLDRFDQLRDSEKKGIDGGSKT